MLEEKLSGESECFNYSTLYKDEQEWVITPYIISSLPPFPLGLSLFLSQIDVNP